MGFPGFDYEVKVTELFGLSKGVASFLLLADLSLLSGLPSFSHSLKEVWTGAKTDANS